MADQEGAETLKQLMQGFTAMQANLGLLPTQSGNQPMGVAPWQPPPPPPIQHPGQASAIAVSQGQAQLQQTMAAAQMTRYVPPPSSPVGGGGFGWGASMNTLSGNQMNPFMASAIGGGGVGMPNPMSFTNPAYGGYRPGGAMASPMMGPARMPGIFNPMAPSMPGAHFMTPAMQSLQILQGYQSQHAGLLSGAVQGGFGLGGSIIGAGLGSMFGPLGSMAGSWLGGKLGGAVGDFMTGPAGQDMRRGRQLQSMSAPWMVSGPMLNPFTGQGMDRSAGRETAHGLRNMWRDPEFEKTGFNTNDVMRITQLASDQGLLATARSPDDITRKVKDISKALKNIIAITGDPDIKDAIASLGQMRNLGFSGLSGQMGAIANRASFARMAGVSQNAMDQMYGQPGAMMGQQLGLAGATGYNAGLAGGGMAGVAVSSGALNNLQLARAGGKQGLGQTNAAAALGAINQDIYMAAALRKGANGDVDVDIGAYRAAQRMDIREVSQRAASNLHGIGEAGIFALSTRKQEFKDKLAQQMSPQEMMFNAIRQAHAMQKTVGHGMTMGAAFQQMGMSSEEARSMELQAESPEFYDGLEQQARVRRRDASDRERSRRGQYRTPGVWKQFTRGVRGSLGDMSEALSQPFADFSDKMDRAAEDRSLGQRGERAMRWRQSQLIDSPQARAMAARYSGAQYGFNSAFSQLGADQFAETNMVGPDGKVNIGTAADHRMRNRIGNAFGFSSYSDPNRVVDIASRSEGSTFGWHPFSSYGDIGSARRRVQDVMGAARAGEQAMLMTGSTTMAAEHHLNTQASSAGMKGFNAEKLVNAASHILRNMPGKAGGGESGTALSGTEMRDAFMQAATASGMSREDAMRVYHSGGNEEQINSLMAQEVYRSGDKKAIERIELAKDTKGAMGAVSGRRARTEISKQINETYGKIGLSGAGKATTEKIKGMLKNEDWRAVAWAAAELEGGAHGEAAMNRIRKSVKSDKELSAIKQSAAQINASNMEDPETRKTLTRMMSRYGELGFQMGGEAVGKGMAVQAHVTALEKIGDAGGDKNADSVFAALSKMDASQIGKIKDEGLRKAGMNILKGKGSEKEVNAAVLASGAKSTNEVFGGESGPATDEIDKSIEDIHNMRKQVAKEGMGGKASANMWASTAELLATAAKELKSAGENFALYGPKWRGEE